MWESIVEKIMDLKDTEKAYIAGLFDGEGTIGIWPNSERKYGCRVAIYNTHKEVMDWLSMKMGGAVDVQSKDKRPCYRWQISHRQSIRVFIKAVQPYTIIKAAQLRLMLEFFQTDSGSQERRMELVQAMKDAKRESHPTPSDDRIN
jgi:hypothetical protein